MISKNLLTLFGSLLTLQVVYAQDSKQLNIDSCYAMARRNYPAIKQFALVEKTKEFTISNANKSYLPQFSLTGIAGYVGGLPTFSLPGAPAPSASDNFKFIGIGQVNQTIWDGGATHVQKDVAKTNAEVENATIETSLYTIRERVNQVYFGILLIDLQISQLELLKENLNRTLNKVKLSKENGLGYQSDVDEIRAEVLTVEQKSIELKYVRSGYIVVLSHLIGKTLTDNITLQAPSNIEKVYAENNRPELRLYSSQRQLVEAHSSINRAYNMPKVGLLGYGILLTPEMNMGLTSFNSLYVAGLSVSWNTSNLYKTHNSKQLDNIQLERIKSQEEVFTFNNNLQLKQSASEIEKQKAIVAKDDEIITLKSKIKQSYQLKYDNGLCSMNDLVTSVYKENEALNNQSLHNIQLLLSLYNYKIQSGN
jgi:outer membrane protein TolC